MTRERRTVRRPRVLGFLAVTAVAVLAGCAAPPHDSPSGESVRVHHTGPTPTAMRHEDVIIPQGRQFWLRVDGVTEEGVDAGVDAFRDVLEQADLPTTKADELRERASSPAATADTPSTKRIGERVDLPDVQGATASVSSTFGPRPDVLVFQLQFSLDWDPVPIP